jgi:hypothetical protein
MTELARILEAVDVHPPSAFTCAGKTVEAKPGRLIESLKNFLYQHCYSREFDTSLPEPKGGEDMVGRLRAAHTGRVCRETTWIVTQVLDGGRIIARKGHAIRRFNPGHYLNLDSALGLPQKDYRVAVSHPMESTVLQESWYYIFGETVGESEEGENVIRFYWNVTSEGAPELVDLLTRSLDRFQLPFQFKLPTRSGGCERRDAGVLYANRRYYRILAMLLEDIRERVSAHLHPSTPLFTKKLADGLGFAESHAGNSGASFGMSRCEILAHALANAAEKNLLTAEEKREELNAEFRKRGLSPERPWLNPPLGAAAAPDYDFP